MGIVNMCPARSVLNPKSIPNKALRPRIWAILRLPVVILATEPMPEFPTRFDADRVNTSQIGFVADIGAEGTEELPNPGLERPSLGHLPAHHTSGRPWTVFRGAETGLVPDPGLRSRGWQPESDGQGGQEASVTRQATPRAAAPSRRAMVLQLAPMLARIRANSGPVVKTRPSTIGATCRARRNGADSEVPRRRAYLGVKPSRVHASRGGEGGQEVLETRPTSTS